MKRVRICFSLLLCLVVAPLHRARAQATTYWATGGDIFLTMIGFNNLPFQLFMEALSSPGAGTLVFEETGTAFSMGGGPMMSNQLLSTSNTLDLGTFGSGEWLRFTMLTAQGPVVSAGLLAQLLDGVQVEMISGTGELQPNETRAEFQLQGVNGIGDNSCTLNGHAQPCLTAAPEPATLVLVGTGLLFIAGFTGMRARRRSVRTLTTAHS